VPCRHVVGIIERLNPQLGGCSQCFARALELAKIGRHAVMAASLGERPADQSQAETAAGS